MKKLYLTFLVASIFILSGCDSQKEIKKESNESQAEVSDQVQNDSEQLSPEEVLARMDAEEGVGLEQGPVGVKIVSPEGEVFSQGQARMYKADISGLVTGSKVRCHWKFYLNQYDEEALYQQMDDEKYAGDLCGFTESFIRDRGILRVHVDVDVTRDDQEGIVQSVSADREYRVE